MPSKSIDDADEESDSSDSDEDSDDEAGGSGTPVLQAISCSLMAFA